MGNPRFPSLTAPVAVSARPPVATATATISQQVSGGTNVPPLCVSCLGHALDAEASRDERDKFAARNRALSRQEAISWAGYQMCFGIIRDLLRFAQDNGLEPPVKIEQVPVIERKLDP